MHAAFPEGIVDDVNYDGSIKAQAVSFRSFDSIDYLCQCMSMLVVMRQEETANIFDRVSQIFG